MSANNNPMVPMVQDDRLTLQYMIDHVFLPRDLSTSCIHMNGDQLYSGERAMLALMCATLHDIEEPFVPDVVRNLFDKLRHLHSQPEIDPISLSTQINELQADEMMGIYVRETNCSLLLKKSPASNEVTMAAFQLNLSNEQIYGDIHGDNLNGDIQVDYPTRAITVEMSNVMTSKAFAEQFCRLHTVKYNLVKADTLSSKYVSEWLIGAVSNCDSRVADDFPMISKKMRDEPTQFFRRSGLWITMKVFLQLSLTITLGEERGKNIYKLIMLKCMTNICSDLSEYANWHPNTIDTAVEMIAKVARRVEKLTEMPDYVQLANSVKQEAFDCISMVRKLVQKQHEELCSESYSKETKKMSKLSKLKSNMDHKLSPDLMSYLESRKNANYRIPLKLKKVTEDVEIDFDPTTPPDIRKIAMLERHGNDHEPLRMLCDAENWVLTYLGETEDASDVQYLRNLTNEYLPKARHFYRNEPVGYSRMILTILKIIQILDKIACAKYPMFLDHNSGIRSKMLETLLLTSRHHLEVLHKLQEYFKIRNVRAKRAGLIEEDEMTEHSFAVRFAEQDADMQETINKIRVLDNGKIQAKYTELQSARKELIQLRKNLSKQVCVCDERGRRRCTRCKLQKKIDNFRIQIHKSLMMPHKHDQNALVFELRIPDEIACLRDALYVFLVHYDQSVADWPKHCIHWVEHDDLKQFYTGCAQNVFLGTNSDYFNRKHSSKYKIHPDRWDYEFINRNTTDYNCLMCGTLSSAQKKTKMPIKTDKLSIKKFVTLNVEKLSVYKNLQWTLESTTHTQNKVLATQFECPSNLSIAEYINFGSLRADGHHLQMRNLYRAIATESLSFETPSVLALVMQTLWEAGPASSQWYREVNEDFVNLDFVRAMCELFTKKFGRERDNWKHPLKLLVSILIVCRMYEINSHDVIAARLIHILLKFRGIAVARIQQITKTLKTSTKHCETNERKNLRGNLIDAAICGIFTYFVNQNHKDFGKVFGTCGSGGLSATFTWLFFNETIDSNSFFCQNSPQREMRKFLLRMAQTVGLNAEIKLREEITKDPEEVVKFVRWRYPDCNDIIGPHHLKNKRHTIEINATTEDGSTEIQIDYVFCVFLVNGLPKGRLPETITGQPVFLRVFGNTNFEVQPMELAFKTSNTHNGFIYIFREDKDDGLIIKEHNVDSVECRKELIPHTKFIGPNDLIPLTLVENYSHWLNLEENKVEFRPKLFREENFATIQGVQYELDLTSRRLKHMKSERFVVDVQNAGFKTISALMKRLEHPGHIVVLMDAPSVARIELVRMKLNFTVDFSSKTRKTFDIISNEYSDMRVSAKQNIGTLFGLEFGLILESMNGNVNKRLLIVPHVKFEVKDCSRHVKVEMTAIDTCELRTPPFFIYHVDNECKTLKANNFAAYFYLAYLHAATSFPFPDPFTGMTGVERALQILQSEFVWSSAPYDAESLNSLSALADLSPRRTFQINQEDARENNFHQSTKWPADIRSHAAHDAFVLIVQKLIADSMRLAHLYTPNEKKSLVKKNPSTTLNARSLARYSPYAPNCSISESFLKIDNRVTHIPIEEVDESLMNVRTLAACHSRNEFHVPSPCVGDLIFELFSLVDVLTGSKTDGLFSIMDCCLEPNVSLANLWLRLYECIRLQKLSAEHLHMAFTLLAFKGKDIRQLQILQTIAANQERFSECAAPNHDSYKNVNCNEIDLEVIRNAIDSKKTPIDTYIERNLAQFPGGERELRSKYDAEVERIKGELILQIKTQWPCECIDKSKVRMNYSKEVHIHQACDIIDEQLRYWYRNHELFKFIQKIDEIFTAEMREFSSLAFVEQPQWPVRDIGTHPFPKYAIDFDQKMCSNYLRHADEIESARQLFVENITDNNNQSTLQQYWEHFRKITIAECDKHLIDAQLYPRLVPTTVLPRLLRPTNDEQRYLIGALAVVMCRAQYDKRQDNANPLHENWHPQEHPEWLLFQIEMDISIRRVQVEIAKRMIHPPDNKHSVMQLNMGEGKTSVIVPIVAAELANGDQLCTLTVLRHLFQTNLRSLRQRVGGMLQRRIYTLPCRRDMNIDSFFDQIRDILEECKLERGILITLPEYRLALQLKIYDAAQKQHFESATKLLNLHNWLNANSRHILDESDAILQPNYQLIYTVGEQLKPDGGELRWTCIQAILKRVPNHMKRLFEQFHDQKIEFNHDYKRDGHDMGNRPEVFTPCRLIDPEVYEHLKNKLADDFLSGELASIKFPDTTQMLRQSIREVLVNDTLSEEQLKRCLDHWDGVPKQTIYILSGLLKFGVLQLALTKRWRVQYGRNERGTRKMAVPYKAKDVAAEMTEFGHPDVAICLTQLSYYYSGLTDVELGDIFERLKREENPAEIYEHWINKVPADLVPETIKSYSGVNLSDVDQRVNDLYPLLRWNMYVIDYWLSYAVYPREATIFANKLMCTAWDLCSDQLMHPVTGFSGTNDTQRLLPMSIRQNDLTELANTNEKVLQTLCRKENDQYQKLPSNIRGSEILKKLAESGIPVLLDAGATMLELTNEQVAHKWLTLVPADNIDAAIYFSGDDILMAIDRKDFITEFEYSVYRERLHRCVVYLDDVHTRGTDLKFPQDTRACVTLSGGMTRDKTVQACMRMRMLGRGHQISFWASHEADIGIRKSCGKSATDAVTTKDVTEYISKNSEQFEKDGMSHWLNASLNYAKKFAAHKYLEKHAQQSTIDALLQQLGERCSDPEFVKLDYLYGAKTPVELMDDARTKFFRIEMLYNKDKEIFKWIRDELEDKVTAKLEENAAGVERCAKFLDGENEKELELEIELEEIREVQRPQIRVPVEPKFNKMLRTFLNGGDNQWRIFQQLVAENVIKPLPYILQRSRLFPIIKPELKAWDTNLWVTQDFLSVVQLNEGDTDDEYLRPIWWIVRVNADNQRHQQADTFIVISPFECNKLITRFRANSGHSTLHMFSAKLSESQSKLINDGALQMPASATDATIPLNTIAQLSMFAGSMYFDSREEESAYCSFMGIIPKPRTAEQDQAFELGYINDSGYVPQRNRIHLPELMCRFEENPDRIALGIIERRRGVSCKRSHVKQIFSEAKRAKWD